MESLITKKKLILIWVAGSYSIDDIESEDKTGPIPSISIWQPPE